MKIKFNNSLIENFEEIAFLTSIDPILSMTRKMSNIVRDLIGQEIHDKIFIGEIFWPIKEMLQEKYENKIQQ